MVIIKGRTIFSLFRPFIIILNFLQTKSPLIAIALYRPLPTSPHTRGRPLLLSKMIKNLPHWVLVIIPVESYCYHFTDALICKMRLGEAKSPELLQLSYRPELL